MRLSELGELGLLGELARRGLAREIGDDAAHLEDGLVVTQDALVDGVHVIVFEPAHLVLPSRFSAARSTLPSPW